MNSITWALYFIGVLPNVSGLLMFFGVSGLLATIVRGIIIFMQDSSLASKYPDYYTSEESINKAKDNLEAKTWFKYQYALLSALLMLFSVLIPNKEVMYAMVASEATEVVAETEAAQKTFDNLLQTVNYQLCLAQGKENCSQ